MGRSRRCTTVNDFISCRGSLFGISVAAAALPELSREAELDETAALRERIRTGFRAVSFAVIPSCFALILFGDWIVSLLFERGSFGAESRGLVHATLAAYSIGLLAAASAKLFASGYHAILDTRTPVKFAVTGLAVGTGTGALLMWPLYSAGLALGGATAAWIHLLLLWGGLDRRLGAIFGRNDLVYVLKLLASSGAGALAGLWIEWTLSAGAAPDGSISEKLLVTAGTLGGFGVVYLVATAIIGVLPPGGPRSWLRRAS